jgi:CHASE3 domain sensor protein
MTTRSRADRQVQLAFGAAIAILLVVGALSYRSIVVSGESNRWVRHTLEVLENLQDLRSAMETVASSIRGFVLTGKDSYLDPYRAGISSIKERAATVRNLTVDNAEQQRMLPPLETLVAERLEHAETIISLRRAQGLEAAADAMRNGPGQRITDEFQALVRQLQGEELRLLVQREADAKETLSRTKTVLILGTVLGLLITAAAGWSVQRDSARRGLAEEALRKSEEQYRMLGAKYRGLLEAAPDAMVVVNQGGKIILLNLQAEKQFGYRRDELIGQEVKSIIPEGFAERLVADGLRSAEDALAQGWRRVSDRAHAEPAGQRRRHPGDGGDPRHQRAQKGRGDAPA